MHYDTPNTIARHVKQLLAGTTESILRNGSIEFDPHEASARREGAKAYIYALKPPAIDETKGSDLERAQSIASSKQRATGLRGRIDVLANRLTSAREQTASLPNPSGSLAGIAISAVCVFTICFSPTILSILSGIQDPPLAWLISLAVGAGVGVFLVQLLLQTRTEVAGAKRSMIVGFGVGVGFGLLRIAKAEGLEDYLIAIGLTVLECAAVTGLDLYAASHRVSAAAYRTTQAQGIALEQAITALKADLQGEQSRYDGLRTELQQREAEQFDVDAVVEHVGWAVEAEYRGSINANKRQLEGGAVFAVAPRSQG